MKRLVALILAFTMCLILSSCTSKPTVSEVTQEEEKTDMIKIGVFEPQSGNYSMGGKQEVLGVNYAQSIMPTVTIGEKEYGIELVFADNKSSYTGAVEAAEKLIDEGVCAVIGSYGSSPLLYAADLFKKSGIPVISPSASILKLHDGYDTIFNLCTDEYKQAKFLAQYAKKTVGLKKAYIICQSGNDYDTALSLHFKETFEAMGGQTILFEFEKGTDDFNLAVAEAADKGCDMIYAPVSLGYAISIIQASVLSRSKLAVFGSDTWDNEIIVSTARGTYANIYCSAFYNVMPSSVINVEMEQWINSDESRTYYNGGQKVSSVSIMSYDAYFAVIEAIKAAGSFDKAEINKALHRIDYDGKAVKMSFEQNGRLRNAQLMMKKLDTFEAVWKEAVS